MVKPKNLLADTYSPQPLALSTPSAHTVTDMKKCTLRAMVKEREQPEVDELLRIAIDIAEPLIFLHERQIIHRGKWVGE